MCFCWNKNFEDSVEYKILEQNDYNSFFESLNNVQKKINNSLLKSKNRKKFFKEFGHLRPMTYSITSKNYKEGFKNYFNTKT